MSKFAAAIVLSCLLVIPSAALAQKRTKNMVPVINALSPTSVTAGGAGFILTVTGSNFTSGTTVQWNGSNLSTTMISSTQLTAAVGNSLVLNAGTAQITAFTSGRWGGTSNSLTFTINAPVTTTPPPPPTSGGTLTITTTSIPSGTVGTAYSYSLTAGGGTTPYTWSIVSGGGALPAGLTLQASGTLAGTPSQAGTFSFTVQVNDAGSQVSQKAFSMSISSSTTTTPSGIQLSPGADIQAAVNANPTGTAFVLAPGVYRLQSVVPKSGNVFSGQAGAILDGAVLITNWQQGTNNWVAQVSGITQETSYRGVCDSTHPVCMYPEDLFFDAQPLTRVAGLSQVATGTWYLDYGTSRVYVGTNPSGHVTEMSALRSAFRGAAGGVTIRNLIIEKYASIAGYGAINAISDAGGPSSGWIVDGNEIRFNHGMGLRISNAMKVTNNIFHHNGQMGLGGSGSGTLIENNEIYTNNTAGYKYGWEAGGTKFTFSTNLTIRGNYSHDNNGPGLWTDINNDYVLYENNRTTRNVMAGIIHEISFHATIRNNQIENDGFASGGPSIWYGSGISISNSSDVEVYGNTVTNSMTGIGGIQTDRGLAPSGTPYTLKNLNVHDNTVTQQTSCAAGIVKSSAYDDSVFTSWGNSFRNNTFVLSDATGKYFCWLGQQWTLTQWQSYWSTH
ncbi:MAG: right-handed parallel beta-helix repeat-containing protein [Terriglobia bacterium]